MKDSIIVELSERLDDIKKQIEEDNIEDDEKFEECVYKLEEEINSLDGLYPQSSDEYKSLYAFLNRINTIKKDYDLFDKDVQIDYMFTNKDDEDYDEESMSYESVYGDD